MPTARVAARGAPGRGAYGRQLSRQRKVGPLRRHRHGHPIISRFRRFGPDVKAQLIAFVVSGDLPAARNKFSIKIHRPSHWLGPRGSDLLVSLTRLDYAILNAPSCLPPCCVRICNCKILKEPNPSAKSHDSELGFEGASLLCDRPLRLTH